MTTTPKPWTVSYDPTSTFTGPFSWREICQTAAMKYWPDGIRFQHQYKGTVAEYRCGVLTKEGRPVNLKRYQYGKRKLNEVLT